MDFAQKIIVSGRKPEYLDLYVGLTENSAKSDSSVPIIENEIGKHLTARESQQFVLLWCSSYRSAGYEERKVSGWEGGGEFGWVGLSGYVGG